VSVNLFLSKAKRNLKVLYVAESRRIGFFYLERRDNTIQI